MLLFEQERGHVVEHHPRLEERRRVDLADPVVCQNRSPRLDDGPAACEPWTAMSLALALLGALRAALRTRTDLALENLALRQQLALLSRRSKRPRFGRLDRAFWLWLSNRWSGWRQALHLVRPETVIRWRRQGFRAFWTWKSHRGRPGRPLVARRLRISCAPWRSRIPSGARHASTANCSSSDSTSRSEASPGSCRIARNRHRRRGARSSKTTSPTSSPSTSSSCRPLPFACSTCSWSCCIIAARSCTST